MKRRRRHEDLCDGDADVFDADADDAVDVDINDLSH